MLGPLSTPGDLSVAVRVLKLLHLSILGVALPFATIAAWGYRDTPWGSVLVPLPGVGLLLLLAAFVFTSPLQSTFAGSVLTGALIATAAAGTLYMSLRVIQVFGGSAGW